mmetsp:Transcript_34222/g.79930  ORF Transcript_34222/g.79930 Transcript_34222/m.79930 type:complete len:231 (-) Transcript_34222:249-941(-)
MCLMVTVDPAMSRDTLTCPTVWKYSNLESQRPAKRTATSGMSILTRILVCMMGYGAQWARAMEDRTCALCWYAERLQVIKSLISCGRTRIAARCATTEKTASSAGVAGRKEESLKAGAPPWLRHSMKALSTFKAWRRLSSTKTYWHSARVLSSCFDVSSSTKPSTNWRLASGAAPVNATSKLSAPVHSNAIFSTVLLAAFFAAGRSLPRGTKALPMSRLLISLERASPAV